MNKEGGSKQERLVVGALVVCPVWLVNRNVKG